MRRESDSVSSGVGTGCRLFLLTIMLTTTTIIRPVAAWAPLLRSFRPLASRQQHHHLLQTVTRPVSARWMSATADPTTTTAAAITVTPDGAAAPPAAKKKVQTRRILSGVQPTGSLHLGNYLGAIRQWVEMQNAPPLLEEQDDDDAAVEIQTEHFYCVVDLHAITMPHDPKDLAESTLAASALYLAAGIDPEKSKIFVQSHVPAHAELAWLLNCMTPMNWLERMIQFKDKAQKQGQESVGVGLFTYPTLMAADILLYHANQVPVGEDQRQHLELARDICRRFHDMYCKGNQFKKRCKAAGIPSRPVFVEPKAMIVNTTATAGAADTARVMSLSDGRSKMSKSDPNDASRINVLDPPDIIRDKIKRCKTDSIVGLEWDNPERPEATNLLNIFQAVQPQQRSREDILQQVQDMSWGEFKPLLAEAIVEHLEPIQQRYHEVRADDEYLHKVLREGAQAANQVAARTLFGARTAMGFVTPPPDL